MTREIRSRRAGGPREQAQQRPLYARMLGLRNLTPSGLLCFAFLEGAIVLGVLLALAELVSWWGVLVLPVTVAAMVKLNDVIAGAVTPPAVAPVRAPRTPIRQRSSSSGAPARPVADAAGAGPAVSGLGGALSHGAVRPAAVERRTAPVAAVPLYSDLAVGNTSPFTRPWGGRAEELDSTQQRARQTATRRYE